MWCSVPQLGHRCATHASLALRGGNEREDSLVGMYFQLSDCSADTTSVTEFGCPVMFDRSCSSRSGGGRGLCRPMAVVAMPAVAAQLVVAEIFEQNAPTAQSRLAVHDHALELPPIVFRPRRIRVRRLRRLLQWRAALEHPLRSAPFGGDTCILERGQNDTHLRLRHALSLRL